MASGGPQAVIDALGTSTAGVTRVLQFRAVGGPTTEASVSKTNFSLDPVSDRYGIKIIDDGGKQDRKSVVEGKSVSVRVDIGGRLIIKKKKKTKYHRTKKQ